MSDTLIEKCNHDEHSPIETVDSNVTITHSVFDSNSALKGGAINLMCDW